MKKNIRKKFREEMKNSLKSKWKDGKIKFLVITFALFVIAWNFFDSVILNLITLTFLVFAYVLYLFDQIKTGAGFFEKLFDSFQLAIIILFYLIYILVLSQKLNLGLFLLTFTVLFVLFLTAVQGLIKLKDAGNAIMRIIITYLQFSVSFIILFGFIYGLVDIYSENNSLAGEINKPYQTQDLVYFSSVTFYTLGYGDIYPKGDLIRLISQIEVIFGAIVHIIFLGWIIANSKK